MAAAALVWGTTACEPVVEQRGEAIGPASAPLRPHSAVQPLLMFDCRVGIYAARVSHFHNSRMSSAPSRVPDSISLRIEGPQDLRDSTFPLWM